MRKIKHWQGYGSVMAGVTRKTKTDIEITVRGDHEWGVVRRDAYDAKHWLLDRFCKDLVNVPYYNLDFLVYAVDSQTAVYTFHPRHGMTWEQVKAL